MKTPPTNAPSHRSRWVRRLLWTALILATVIPLYYAIENWRGAKAWQQARSAYEAAGETLDWDQLLTDVRIPDADNFFAVPLLYDIGKHNDGQADAMRNRLNGPSKGPSNRRVRLNAMSPDDRARLGGFEHGRPTDYKVWREIAQENGLAMPPDESDDARAILLGVEDAIDWFPEIGEASNRTQSQILPLVSEQFDASQPWTYGQPHIGAIRSMAHWLSYRAKAAAGCHERAIVRTSLTSIFRLIQGMKNEPTMINYLVTTTMTAILLRPLWDTLHLRLWDDAELQWVESQLAQLQLPLAYRQMLRTEATYLVSILDHVKYASLKESAMLMGLTGPQGSRLSGLKILLTPDGHIDRERALRLTEFLQLQEALNSPNLAPAKKLMKTFVAEANADASNPFRRFGDMAMFSKVLVSSAQIFTQVRQARIAIGIERYFLVHQRYPEDLVELTPAYIDALPEDPMGKAWQYRPSPQRDTYLLYSLGWNMVDDGGVPPKRGKRETGDIVWTR